MAQFDNFAPRQMFKGNWKCSSCGKEITELPFEPRAERMNELKCRDCFKQSRDENRGNRFGGGRR